MVSRDGQNQVLVAIQQEKCRLWKPNCEPKLTIFQPLNIFLIYPNEIFKFWLNQDNANLNTAQKKLIKHHFIHN